jgi:mannose-6-phosphate isomerase-like protein (cupin superfamily)
MSLTVEQLKEFAEMLVASPEHWQHHVRHDDDMRVYELIWQDEDVNAWVICWSTDQDTGFHDHDESAAAIAVISGQVREDRLRMASAPRTRVVSAGSTLTVPAEAIHRVLHAGEHPAVTIHAYSPPLVRTGAYRIGTDGELERETLSIEHELRPAQPVG